VYIAIKADSPGRVLFMQQRLAQGGGNFNLYKYRSMYTHADRILDEHLKHSQQARLEWETYKKLKIDPRVTRVGLFIRKWSIDELPQLFNVIKGDMSLVGPRPYLPREVEDMYGHQELILKARPGITGLWQVSGRSSLTFDDRLRLDTFYVRNWSLWLDLSVLFKTFSAIFTRGGAY
ncbi:MAG: sugar transferase, partial [Deltaproteobacteria bacterium]|nr:sugar transferase [Deltaproteobacteria bacterium]